MLGLRRGSVRLEKYQPEWKKLFEEEASFLRSVLGEHGLHFEHIGSTAIENMDAKPIIDMMVTISSLEKAKSLIPVLESIGYEIRPNDTVPDRLLFAKGPHSNRTHYLSLAEPTSNFYIEKLLFRDYLRTHKDKALEYCLLKRELSVKYPDERDKYTAGKKDFVEQILLLARSL